MSILTVIVDRRKQRIRDLLFEAKRERPRNIEKIKKLRMKLNKLKEEDFLG